MYLLRFFNLWAEQQAIFFLLKKWWAHVRRSIELCLRSLKKWKTNKFIRGRRPGTRFANAFLRSIRTSFSVSLISLLLFFSHTTHTWYPRNYEMRTNTSYRITQTRNDLNSINNHFWRYVFASHQTSVSRIIQWLHTYIITWFRDRIIMTLLYYRVDHDSAVIQRTAASDRCLPECFVRRNLLSVVHLPSLIIDIPIRFFSPSLFLSIHEVKWRERAREREMKRRKTEKLFTLDTHAAAIVKATNCCVLKLCGTKWDLWMRTHRFSHIFRFPISQNSICTDFRYTPYTTRWFDSFVRCAVQCSVLTIMRLASGNWPSRKKKKIENGVRERDNKAWKTKLFHEWISMSVCCTSTFFVVVVWLYFLVVTILLSVSNSFLIRAPHTLCVTFDVLYDRLASNCTLRNNLTPRLAHFFQQRNAARKSVQ